MNFNLRATADGLGEDRGKEGPTAAHDGKTDTLVLVSADEATGAPLRQIERSYVQAPLDWGIPRAAVYANEGAHAFPPTPYLFWVLLGNVSDGYEGWRSTANALGIRSRSRSPDHAHSFSTSMRIAGGSPRRSRFMPPSRRFLDIP